MIIWNSERKEGVQMDTLQEKEMKDKWKYLLVLVLALLALLAGRVTGWGEKKKEKEGYRIAEDFDSTPASPKESVDRNMIHSLENRPEDHYRLWEEDTEEMQITFQGYDENPEDFAWLSKSDWERFQMELKAYLSRKGMEEVTVVRLHPDSIQQINPYERNVYLDADYQTADTDTMKIKAVCDTYKGTMRFAFSIQYGD